MRLVKFSSLLFGIVVLLLTSCSKYEEGPAISLRSKKERVVNTWNVDKWTDEEGDDQTNNASSVTMTFEDDNDATIAFSAFGQTFEQNGEWEFRNDKEDLAIVPDDPNSEEAVFTILLLKEDEMKLEGDGEAEIELSGE